MIKANLQSSCLKIQKIQITVTLHVLVIFAIWIAALLALMIWRCFEAAWLFEYWSDKEATGDDNRALRNEVAREALMALLFFFLIVFSFCVRYLVNSRNLIGDLLDRQSKEIETLKSQLPESQNSDPQNSDSKDSDS